MNPYIINEPTVISFSGGRTSAYMLHQVLLANDGLPEDAYVCFANTGKEEEATLKFVHDCETNWTCPIIWLEYADTPSKFEIVNFETASRNGKPFDHLTTKRKYLPNPIARFCTSELKILSIDRYMKSVGHKEYETMVGIRADEPRRVAKMKDSKLVPLYHDGITQDHVQSFWKSNSFDLGLDFRDGVTPLGNCDLCFLKGPNQIMSLISDKPDRAIWWAQQEEKINGTFRNDRPKYSEMMKFAKQQQDMFDDSGSISCFCGD
jgi:3'-phosphoadenosine 5'-phosphosulfate sulfotransferase (PAPS reductase)/FAD synthetase